MLLYRADHVCYTKQSDNSLLGLYSKYRKFLAHKHQETHTRILIAELFITATTNNKMVTTQRRKDK